MWSVNAVVILLCLKNVLSLNKEFCLPTDNECLTKAIQDHVYEKFVRGLDGVESSDPLYLDKIVVDLPNLKYVLNKATLIGLGNCDFLKLRLTQDGGNFVTYELLCPRLVIKSQYEAKGEIDGATVEGKDTCEITYDNYYINITSKYDRIEGEDSKQHFHIIEFWLKLDNQAQATIEYKNLSISGIGNDKQFSRKLESRTREIVMKTFLDKYAENLKDFQRVVPLEELHFRYV